MIIQVVVLCQKRAPARISNNLGGYGDSSMRMRERTQLGTRGRHIVDLTYFRTRGRVKYRIVLSVSLALSNDSCFERSTAINCPRSVTVKKRAYLRRSLSPGKQCRITPSPAHDTSYTFGLRRRLYRGTTHTSACATLLASLPTFTARSAPM